MSASGPLRTLDVGYENPSPFKNQRSPMFELPGGSGTTRIRTDPAHTYAIGYGKDEQASVLMVLINIGHFGSRGKIDLKLDTAFESFATYCKKTGKHTSIISFDKKQFKIQKLLGYVLMYALLFSNGFFSEGKLSKLYRVRNPRSGMFPCGGGKGHDTAVLGSWLETQSALVEVDSVEPMFEIYIAITVWSLGGLWWGFHVFSLFCLSKDPDFREIVEVMKYMNTASCHFWRTLYEAKGVFLDRATAEIAIASGWAMVDTLH